MHFTFRQLEYFVAVAATGTVAGAAERMNISAPSISVAITQLEKEFMVKLFARHHAKGLTMTEEGERFLIEAQTILKQANSLDNATRFMSEEVGGTIELGCLSTIAPIIVPKLCKGFLKHYPDIKFTFHDAPHAELINKLHLADIGIALTFCLKIPKDIIFAPLVALPPYVMISANNPLAQKESLSLNDLKDTSFIQIGTSPMKEYAMSIFHKEKTKPKVLYKSPHSSIQTYVAHDYGYTFTYIRPKLEQNLDGSRLVTIPLKGTFDPLIMGTAMVNKQFQNPAIKAFHDYCCQHISEKSIPGALAPGASGLVN